MDVTPLVFLPFFGVVAVLGIGVPTAAVLALRWRRAAARRTSVGGCGRCAAPMSVADEQFLVLGRPVCRACANTLRRRVGGSMMAVALTITALLTVSTGAVLVDLVVDGAPSWRWWTKNARLAVVVLPTVALLTASVLAIRVGALANRLGASRVMGAGGGRPRLPLLARLLATFELPEEGHDRAIPMRVRARDDKTS